MLLGFGLSLTEIGVITLQYLIVQSMSRWYDRRLPIHNRILDGPGVLQELLVVQWEHQLHDVLQFGLDLGVRSPEKQAQISEISLELLSPRHQYEMEHVTDGVLHNGHRRKRWLASLPPELPWDAGNYVTCVDLERDIRRFIYSKDGKKVLDIAHCESACSTL